MSQVFKGCGKPVVDGQAKWSAAEHRGEFWHWECHTKKAYDPFQRLHDLADEMRTTSIAMDPFRKRSDR